MENKKTIGDRILDRVSICTSVLDYKSFHNFHKNHFPNPVIEMSCGVANWALFGVHAKLRNVI